MANMGPTNIGSAYISIEADDSKFRSQIGNIKSQIAGAGGLKSGALSNSFNREFTFISRAAVQMGRQVSSVLKTITAPVIGALAKTVHSLFTSQSTAGIQAQNKWFELNKVIRSNMVRIGEYVMQSKIFGKTMYEWVEKFSDKLKGIGQKDIQKLINLLEKLAIAFGLLKGAEIAGRVAQPINRLLGRYGLDSRTAAIIAGDVGSTMIAGQMIGGRVSSGIGDASKGFNKLLEKFTAEQQETIKRRIHHGMQPAAAIYRAETFKGVREKIISGSATSATTAEIRAAKSIMEARAANALAAAGLTIAPDAMGRFRNQAGQLARVDQARIRGTQWQGIRTQVGESVVYSGMGRTPAPAPAGPGVIVGSLSAAGARIRTFLAGWGGVATASIASVAAVASWLGIIKDKLSGKELNTSTTENIKTGLGVLLTAVGDVVTFIPNLVAYLAGQAGGGGKDWKRNYEKMMLGEDYVTENPVDSLPTRPTSKTLSDWAKANKVTYANETETLEAWLMDYQEKAKLKKWSKDQDYEEPTEARKAWFQYYRDMNTAAHEYAASLPELHRQMNQKIIDDMKDTVERMSAGTKNIKALNERLYNLDMSKIEIDRKNAERMSDFNDKFEEMAIVMGMQGAPQEEVIKKAKEWDKKRVENLGRLGYSGQSVGYTEAGKFTTGIQVDFQKQQMENAKSMLDLWKGNTRATEENTRAVLENTAQRQKEMNDTEVF